MIVLGVGAMGAATCHALAARGARVLGLERYDIPHGLGSSGGQTRLVRLAYYEHPHYVPLLQRAYAGWDALGEELGAPVLHRTGVVYFGRPDGDLIAGSLRAAHEHALPYEMLDAAAVQRRCGPFQVPDDYVALFEPDAGFVYSERAVAGFAEGALRRGAVIHGREPALAWRSDAAGVEVDTERATYRADQLVITAGAWTGALARELGVELTVTRQILAWVWPREPAHFALGRFPCWAAEPEEPGRAGIYYGFPMLPERPGLKVGYHCPGPVVSGEPDPPTLADEAEIRPALARLLPAADGALLSLRRCLYTLSPDHHFLVERHPGHERVTVGCGFSGHGFKFAPVIGLALADLATEGRSELPIEFLSRARLAATGGAR
ncbi:MAG: N-methyl-L-tryptophan oxidase [Haliangiales bacterium]